MVAYPSALVARQKLITTDAPPQISAAGGVMIRREDGAPPRVAVIHRPKYMDWSLPKGKLEPGESWEQAALREVKEETGFDARNLEELPPVSYRDRKARSKLVRYWLMEPLEGGFEPHGEVDELRWLTRREAVDLLTYDHDRELVNLAMRPRWLKRLFGR
jgi:8-oxo-dGTP diphosphatase